MSRPIKMTPELKAQMAQDFIEHITKQGFANGTIEFKKTYKWEGTGKASRALISFDPIAYLEMELLVKNFTTEVAWHFVVERREHAEYAMEYHISETLHFPQLVNASHFEQDDRKCPDCEDTRYNRWKMALTDYQWDHLRGHGHSHAMAAVSPSTEDERYQKKMVDAYEDFYLFVIWNKQGDKNVWIYDIDHNVMFEKTDVDITINCDEVNFTEFLDAARKQTDYIAYQTNNTYNNTYNKRTGSAITPINNGVNGGQQSGKQKKKNKKRADDNLPHASQR